MSVVRARASVAIILLMGMLALCTFAGYAAAVMRGSGNSARVDMDATRFQNLRKELPARGVVGYLSDITEGLEGTRGYYLTQYYVAPVVVARDSGHELVIANFASRDAVAAAAEAHNLAVVRDFRNGVALLRRVTR